MAYSIILEHFWPQIFMLMPHIAYLIMRNSNLVSIIL